MSKNEVAKGSIATAKEQELAYLEKRLKKIRTQLKRNKTLLQNLKESIESLQSKVNGSIIQKMEEVDSIRRTVMKLLKQVQASKAFTQAEKQEVLGLGEVFGENLFGDDFEEFQRKKEAHSRGEFDPSDFEQEYDRFSQLLNQFEVKPNSKEQRNIRKVFIQLAARFHPDKASSPKEAIHFHQLMQRINNAYEKGDISTLLDIETEYATYKTVNIADFQGAEEVVSFLQQQIDRKKQELKLLESQLSRVKKELKNLRASDLAKVHKEEKRAYKRHGISPIEQEKVQLDELITVFSGVKTVLEDALEKEEFSEELIEKITALMPQQDPFSMIMEAMMEMDEEDDEYGDFFVIRNSDEIVMPEEMDADMVADMFSSLFDSPPSRKGKGKRRRKERR